MRKSSRSGSLTTMTLCLLALALASGVALRDAAAARAGVLNCTRKTITLCIYDGSDNVKFAPSGWVTLKAGEVSKDVTCKTSGSCQVTVLDGDRSCLSRGAGGSTGTLINPGQRLENSAYKIQQDGSFDRMSSDPDFVVDPSHHRCMASKADGDRCSADQTCYSSNCVGGFCCATSCDGTCMTCETGACKASAYGAQGANCRNASVKKHCVGTANLCIADRSIANGQKCYGALDCKSGFCADGVCCDASCDGQCRACNLSGTVGTCTFLQAGTVDDTCHYVHMRCDGAGTCAQQDPNQGVVTCKSDAECPRGNTCQSVEGMKVYDSDTGTTVVLHGRRCALNTGLAANGAACGTGYDCKSGSCHDGVCCDKPCTELCMSCKVPDRVGVCSPVPNGQEWWNPQLISPSAPQCLHHFQRACDGAGRCAPYSR